MKQNDKLRSKEKRLQKRESKNYLKGHKQTSKERERERERERDPTQDFEQITIWFKKLFFHREGGGELRGNLAPQKSLSLSLS